MEPPMHLNAVSRQFHWSTEPRHSGSATKSTSARIHVLAYVVNSYCIYMCDSSVDPQSSGGDLNRSTVEAASRYR